MIHFHASCKKLTDVGILPATVVDIARATVCPEVLAKAFPSMPEHVQMDLMLRRRNITFTPDDGWRIEFSTPFTIERA